MDRRYQIFVSSTFRDLEDERKAALDAILELGHFPSGMEMFPAANDTAWRLIERIIQDCDYYILIIGGRYGSTTSDGISYTEKEYDWATSLGIPVLAFLHRDPDSIPGGKLEIDPKSRKRLAQFRKKIEREHHCRYWKESSGLKSNILSALASAIRIQPRIGWTRADGIDNSELLKQVNELRQRLDTVTTENAKLTAALEPLDRSEPSEFNQVFTLRAKFLRGPGENKSPTKLGDTSDEELSLQASFRELFTNLAPYFLFAASELTALSPLNDLMRAKLQEAGSPVGVTRVVLLREVIRPLFVELMGLGLFEPVQTSAPQSYLAVSIDENGWKLTAKGRMLLAALKRKHL
jgi:hypothetical protein